MLYRILIPILILGVIALIALLIVRANRRREEIIEEEHRLQAEKEWTGKCEFDNPETGAKCQREEFHLENHYRDVRGHLVTW